MLPSPDGVLTRLHECRPSDQRVIGSLIGKNVDYSINDKCDRQGLGFAYLILGKYVNTEYDGAKGVEDLCEKPD